MLFIGIAISWLAGCNEAQADRKYRVCMEKYSVSVREEIMNQRAPC